MQEIRDNKRFGPLDHLIINTLVPFNTDSGETLSVFIIVMFGIVQKGFIQIH